MTHFIMEAEAQAVQYALLAFQDHLRGQLDIEGNSTSLMGAAPQDAHKVTSLVLRA